MDAITSLRAAPLFTRKKAKYHASEHPLRAVSRTVFGRGRRGAGPAAAKATFLQGMEQNSLEELLERARQELDAGRLDEAQRALDAAQLRASVPMPHALRYLRGVLALERGKPRTAAVELEQAVLLAPGCARSATALGHARLACGDAAAAATAYRCALAREPEVADRHADLAAALRAAGEPEAAEAACGRALALEPAHAGALNQRGILCEDRGALREASEAFRAALRADPDAALLHANLARVLLALGDHAEAARHYERALTARPDAVGWLNGWACALRAGGSTAEAAGALERAHALDPASLPVLRNLVCVRYESGALGGALELCERAFAAHPHDEALLAWLVQLRTRSGAWSGLEELRAALDRATERALAEQRRAPEAPLDHVARCLDPPRNRDVARSWARQVQVREPLPRVEPHQRRARARIRLGYCGGDFREHPIAHLIAGVLERHHRGRFEVYVLSYGPPDRSAIRARIAAGCDRFTELSGLADGAAARRIREAGIDVLVELTTHTQYGRLGITAARPAAVQIAYLGFPGTTGAPWFDYLIADREVVPPAARAACDEAVVFLPRCYQASDAAQRVHALQPERAALGLPAYGGVFCAFHRAQKLDAEVVALWMRILRRCPGSVLWLLASDLLSAALRVEAVRHGVAPERLVFAASAPRERHLARLRCADLALDTLRYNGHTTTSDALWMGVPVVAAEGSHFASRVSASILRCAGLPELVAPSVPAYEELAVGLMNDPAARGELARRLGEARTRAPYFDTDGCARDLENAYGEVWRRFLAGLPPADLALPAHGVPACTEFATLISP
jgi:protein O-GlcNAc transferase